MAHPAETHRDVIEFYPQIRWLHIATAMTSGALFALRFVLMQSGFRWPMAWPVRYLSYTIDTALLTAALMLVTMLQQYPFVHSWLTVKVLLLVVYVVLGSLALRYAPTRRAQIVCGVSALIVYLAIISVARAHHPLGALALLSQVQ